MWRRGREAKRRLLIRGRHLTQNLGEISDSPKRSTSLRYFSNTLWCSVSFANFFQTTYHFKNSLNSVIKNTNNTCNLLTSKLNNRFISSIRSTMVMREREFREEFARIKLRHFFERRTTNEQQKKHRLPFYRSNKWTTTCSFANRSIRCRMGGGGGGKTAREKE